MGHLHQIGLRVGLVALGMALSVACQQPEAGVLVNVQLETTDLQVSQLRLRGYAASREGFVLEVDRARPDGARFEQTENIYVEVPRSWIGDLVWFQAEGMHEGAVSAHGSVSVIPRKDGVVEATLVLVAGASPCGNGVVDPAEQCDGTQLAGHSCASLTGLVHGVPSCVRCLLDTTPCHQCGNGEIEMGPESCDGENLGPETCQSQGFVAGELSCTADCRLDRTLCVQGCGNNVLEPPEACDGEAMGTVRCADLGFLWGHVSCTADCGLDTSGCVGVCGDGVLDSLEDCDGSDFGEQSCQTAAGRLEGALGCTASCHLDISGCHHCGDGVIEATEQCDGSSLAGQSCQSLGFDVGTLACGTSCDFDTLGCSMITCGNSQLDAGEECDGANVAGQDCVSQGFDLGTLVCGPTCQFDTSGCSTLLCGNGLLDAGEACDGPNLAGQDCVSRGYDLGTLSCASDCTFDESQCAVYFCGDGLITGIEQCEGANLNGMDCVGFGFTGGTLACDAGCLFDTAGCTAATGCGNGAVSGAEECDDGNLVAGDGCDPSCHLEPGYHCYDDPSVCVPDSAVIFVDCAAPCVGSGTLADPYCSIQNAVGNATNGQLIWLLAGSCVEDVIVGPTDADVVLAGEVGVQWSGTSCPALKVDDRDVQVWRLHILEGIEVLGTTASITVKNSEIGPSTGSCQAVLCIDQSHCELHRNHIHDNAEGGLWMNGATFRIVNNLIVDNGTLGSSRRGGLALDSSGSLPAEVVNNTIAYNLGRGSPFLSGVNCVSAVELRNNILWMNDTPDLSSLCDPWYNDISSSTWNGVQNNISLGPQFVDQPAGDYHLQPTSPCVDAGDPAGIPPAPEADVDGQSRYLGTGVDMGADEAS